MMNLVTFSCLMLVGQVVYSQETPVVLCGRVLANTRVLVCFGAEYMRKRSASNDLMNIESGEHWSPWKRRQEALAGAWTRAKRDSLVEECCVKGCYKSEILNYC